MQITKVCVRVGEVRQTQVKFESKRCEVELTAQLEPGDKLADAYDRLYVDARRQVSAFFEETPEEMKAELAKYRKNYGRLV